MVLVNNRVGQGGADGAAADGRALVESLVKAVAWYRHLASCVGGCTDSLKLWEELRQTREKAQELAATTCRHLTARLRDKSLPPEERKEMELLWVAFSCSLELLHVDMCKVFNMGDVFSVANAPSLVKTGMQGGGSEPAARALSLPDLQNPNLPPGLDREERSAMEQDIGHVAQMIDQMESKVNVLRWMVEARGPQYAEPLSSSTDGSSLALLSVDEEQAQPRPPSQHAHILVLFLLLAVVLLAASLSISVKLFS